MKFCAKCGAPAGDTDKFCQNCGAPLPDAAVNQQSGGQYQNSEQYQPGEAYQSGGQYQPGGQYQSGGQQYQNAGQYQSGGQYQGSGQYQPGGQQYQNAGQYQAGGQFQNSQPVNKPKGKLFIPVIIAAAAFIAIIVCVINIFAGSGSLTMKGAVKNYYKAAEKCSGKAYVEATCSPSMLKAIEKEMNMSKSRIISYFNIGIGYLFDEGTKYKNIKITAKEKMDKADVKDAVEEIKDETGYKVKMSAVYEVTAEYSVYDPDYEEWDTDEDDLIVYKSGGKWYVMPDGF